MKLIAGVDEAGRGPLAGPVVAAAVILPPLPLIPSQQDNSTDETQQAMFSQIKDSKQLSPQKRAELSNFIKQESLSYAITSASVEEIDRLNILQASLLAMHRALEDLSLAAEEVLVDGNHLPDPNCQSQTKGETKLPTKMRAVVGGDSKYIQIAAASILAKVARDEMMIKMDERYPGYGFKSHKGYPTKDHIQQLRTRGVLPIHRRTFAPVKLCLADD